MTDIVERLRRIATPENSPHTVFIAISRHEATEAADEIERLRAECEALRVERDLHVRLYEARLREFNAAMGKTPT